MQQNCGYGPNIVNKDCRGQPENQLKVRAKSLMKYTLGNIRASNPFPTLLREWFFFFNVNLIVEIPNLKCFTCQRQPSFFGSFPVDPAFLPYLIGWLPFLPSHIPLAAPATQEDLSFPEWNLLSCFPTMDLLLTLPETFFYKQPWPC